MSSKRNKEKGAGSLDDPQPEITAVCLDCENTTAAEAIQQPSLVEAEEFASEWFKKKIVWLAREDRFYFLPKNGNWLRVRKSALKEWLGHELAFYWIEGSDTLTKVRYRKTKFLERLLRYALTENYVDMVKDEILGLKKGVHALGNWGRQEVRVLALGDSQTMRDDAEWVELTQRPELERVRREAIRRVI